MEEYKTCKNCSKVIYRYKKKIGVKEKIQVSFCNRRCYGEHKRETNRNYITYKVCKECKKVFSNVSKNNILCGRSRSKGRIFCSLRCVGNNRRTFCDVYQRNTYCFIIIKNKEFKFSKKHLKRVILHSWCETGSGYAGATISGKTVLLHQFLFGKTINGVTDHINRDKTDNRDENLRFVSHRENIRNSSIGDKWSEEMKNK